MFDAYMRLLRRVFGDQGAISAYLILRRVGYGFAALLVIGVFAGLAVFWPSGTEELELEGYELARVTQSEILDGDARFGVVANVLLSDGTSLRLVATQGAVAQEISDMACVEISRGLESGRAHYRLVRRSDCAER